MTPVIVFAVIGFIIVFLVAVSFMGRSNQENSTTPRQPVEIDWDALDDPELQAALAQDNKIVAIKRYRTLTGQGLKESKDAIDYAKLHPDERGTKKKKAAYDAQDAGIRDLIQDGRLDEAIEIYQKFAGVDAYTARDAVNEIAHDLHLSNQSTSRTTFESPPTDQSNHN